MLYGLRRIDRPASRFDQPVVEQRQLGFGRHLRLGAHRDRIERLQPGAFGDACLARQLSGKTGARGVAGDGRAEAGNESGVGLQRFGELRRGAARARRLAGAVLGAEADLVAGGEDGERRIARRRGGERLRRLLQQAGPVEDFQAQGEELLVGDAARRAVSRWK